MKPYFGVVHKSGETKLTSYFKSLDEAEHEADAVMGHKDYDWIRLVRCRRGWPSRTIKTWIKEENK